MRRCLALLVALAAACTPALDWREVRPSGTDAQVLFPCKPSSETRRVVLAGAAVEMTMLSCTAGDAMWAVGHADVGDPGRVTPALSELAAAASGNVGGVTGASRPLELAGMTPNPGARRLSVTGTRPDGRPVVWEAAVFAKGTRVFQASVVGAAPDAQGVEIFFEGLRLPS